MVVVALVGVGYMEASSRTGVVELRGEIDQLRGDTSGWESVSPLAKSPKDWIDRAKRLLEPSLLPWR